MRAFGRHGSDVSHLSFTKRALPKNNFILCPARRSIASQSGRQCLSDFWTPTGGITASEGDQSVSQALLTQAGFIRQSNSGIFHLLPLGLRVQNKIEALVDKHMRSLAASKVSLSSITSEALWKKSGRFSGDGKGNPELFRLRDANAGKDASNTGFLLAPTHEEEITELVGSTIKSHKELPLRLYQTSRKYRNELRPRQGLLRAREFLMKDLYTFDLDHEHALKTYNEVRVAYAAFFDELRIPYLTAEADSGNMGGSLSHEYHYVTAVGEDNIISCDSCSYVANEEKALSRDDPYQEKATGKPQIWVRATGGGRDLVLALLPAQEGDVAAPNWHALKRVVPSVMQDIADPTYAWATYEGPEVALRNIYVVADYRVDDKHIPKSTEEAMRANNFEIPAGSISNLVSVATDPTTNQPINLLSIREGDRCAKCDHGHLRVQRAVELGHTFHLGSRYSSPLNCTIGLPAEDPRYDTTVGHRVPLEMGCHGIGISRLIGAVAHILSDSTGLNWPRAIAPFEAVIIAAEGFEKEGRRLYNVLANRRVDVVLDDRKQSTVWKLKDADLVGHPVILLVTKRSWGDHHSVEVQCRRATNYKKNHRTEEEDLGKIVDELLQSL